ncbi:aldo/keto reductase [Gloeothece verrucosa]|uniref:Aryl-alcohol dehydrogenase-like oxidoreductase n=1 Tax=Gloeothece verrucosa (strain PCC 7822) TaxID=497965 RepID=E0UHG5_GLOV7|nr:aldo/keto reductase [Gloeothece verrucosa]ADN12106.1 aryl-alcohol dehydrogenase-like oxidoreductase [Gloeothece verrucosa PCC 7822]
MDIVTLEGKPVSRLGLAGHPNTEESFVMTAFRNGINFFFFYDPSFINLLNGLKSLMVTHREQLIIATGTESRDLGEIREQLQQIRQFLNTDVVDVFLLQYVSPDDTLEDVQAALEQLHIWKSQGLIRYVGASVHNRPLALHLIKSGLCEVLMNSYIINLLNVTLFSAPI